jgi:hypothetical protein
MIQADLKDARESWLESAKDAFGRTGGRKRLPILP